MSVASIRPTMIWNIASRVVEPALGRKACARSPKMRDEMPDARMNKPMSQAAETKPAPGLKMQTMPRAISSTAVTMR